MKTSKTDPNVKKTLLRNYEKKVTNLHQVIHETESQTSLPPRSDENSRTSQKDNLNAPSICSSEVYFNYLKDLKKTSPPTLAKEKLKAENANIGTKITKKLNFHFNDRMFDNLIELNTGIDNVGCKKGRQRPSSSATRIRKDLEPDIEDFYQDIEEPDSPPNIPGVKPKFKPIRPIYNGHLHKLVAEFENLT